MISFPEMFVYAKGGFSIVHVFPVAVESNVEWCFLFSTVLCATCLAIEEADDFAAFAVKVMPDVVRFLGDLT